MPCSSDEVASIRFPLPTMTVINGTERGHEPPDGAMPRSVAVLFSLDPVAPVTADRSWAVARWGPFAVLTRVSRFEATPLDTVLPGAQGWVLSLSAPAARGATPCAGGASGVVIASLEAGALAEVGHGDDIVLAVPLDAFPETSGRLSSGAPLLSGIGSMLLAEHLRGLARLLPTERLDDIAVIADATRQLLDACLASRMSSVAGDDGEASRQRECVERVIRDNLSSARLDTKRICELCELSRSALYRLFEKSGGVAAYVRVLRLNLVLSDLADPALAHLPIATIAERRGLYCTPSFNRAFRRAFGRTPGDVRAEALAARGYRPAPGAGAVVPEIREVRCT